MNVSLQDYILQNGYCWTCKNMLSLAPFPPQSATSNEAPT